MASNEIKYRVDVDASRANRGLDKFGRAARDAGKDVTKAMDDTASAGDKARAAIEQMAAAMDSELREAAAAADALGQALGPELTAKMDVNEVVADLNRMGVAFDDIRVEADQFAQTLKKIDDTKMGQVNAGLGKTQAALDKVRGSSDQSRSVMANLSGNAAQSAFQSLGGTIGDVGVGIGQLAEYAVDGNIALGNLAKLAGPMVALGVATAAVSTAIKGVKAKEAFEAGLVEDFTDAMRDGQTVAETLRDTIRETGKLEFTDVNRGFLNLDTATANLIPNLVELGITYDEFIELVQSGKRDGDLAEATLRRMSAGAEAAHSEFGVMDDTIMEVVDAIQQYADSGEHAIVTTEQLTTFLAGAAVTSADITAAMNDATSASGALAANWDILLGSMASGQPLSERAVDSFNDLMGILGVDAPTLAAMALEKVAERNKELADASFEAADAGQENADALRAEADAAEAAAEAISAQADAQRAAVDSYYALREAREAQVDAVHAVAEAEAEHGAGSVEYREALEDVIDTVDQTAQATVQLAKDQAESEGATMSAVEAIDLQNDTLIAQASQLTGPSRRAVLQHTAALNGIPPEVISEIEALLDEGKVQEAEDRIEELSETREMEVKAAWSLQAAASVRELANSLAAPQSKQIVATLQPEPGFNDKVKRLTQDEEKRVTVIVRGRRVGGSTGAAGGANPVMAPTATTMAAGYAAPARAAPTAVTVNVNSAVIGSRFDVMRAVAAATAQGVRLGVR